MIALDKLVVRFESDGLVRHKHTLKFSLSTPSAQIIGGINFEDCYHDGCAYRWRVAHSWLFPWTPTNSDAYMIGWSMLAICKRYPLSKFASMENNLLTRIAALAILNIDSLVKTGDTQKELKEMFTIRSINVVKQSEMPATRGRTGQYGILLAQLEPQVRKLPSGQALSVDMPGAPKFAAYQLRRSLAKSFPDKTVLVSRGHAETKNADTFFIALSDTKPQPPKPTEAKKK